MTVPQLPPSSRDFEIFFAIAFHSASTRRTAELHKISQTRVRQIVALVGDWVADNLPDWGEADLKKQVRLAQHVAANRLEHQYEQTMNYWNAEGDPKYLRQATRIALAQARLGITAGRIHALAADVTDGPAILSGADIPVCHTDLVTRVPPGNALTRGSSLADATTTLPLPDPCLLSPDPSTEDCSPPEPQTSRPEPTDDDDSALTDSPETLIESERQHRLNQFEGLTIMERRLLTLIENEGSANPDKVVQLNETLARVRASKATAEIRLSRFIHGIHIEPLNDKPHSASSTSCESETHEPPCASPLTTAY